MSLASLQELRERQERLNRLRELRERQERLQRLQELRERQRDREEERYFRFDPFRRPGEMPYFWHILSRYAIWERTRCNKVIYQ